MKQLLISALVSCLCLSSLSFSPRLGGDVFRIYLNGRQVHQQFLHASNATETFSLNVLNENDRVGIFYSHCGKTGSGRKLSLRNEKNETVRTLSFPDAPGNTSMMQFSQKDLPAGNQKLQLFYTSKELPTGCPIVTLSASRQKMMAKTASL